MVHSIDWSNIMLIFSSSLANMFYIFYLKPFVSGAIDHPSFFMLLKQLVHPLSAQLSDRRSSIVKQVLFSSLLIFIGFMTIECLNADIILASGNRNTHLSGITRSSVCPCLSIRQYVVNRYQP